MFIKRDAKPVSHNDCIWLCECTFKVCVMQGVPSVGGFLAGLTLGLKW